MDTMIRYGVISGTLLILAAGVRDRAEAQVRLQVGHDDEPRHQHHRRAVARDRDPPQTPSLFRTTLERALSVSPKLATDLAQRVGLIEATPAEEEVDPLTAAVQSDHCMLVCPRGVLMSRTEDGCMCVVCASAPG